MHHAIYPGGEDPDVINEFIEMDRFGNPVPPRSPRPPPHPTLSPSPSPTRPLSQSRPLSTVREFSMTHSLPSGRALSVSHDEFMRRMGVQEYEEGELKPAVHFPAFICAISIIQIVIFLNFDEKYMISILGNNPDRRSELWRFFTTSFVHNSHNHLWHNLVMQLYLGALIELYHGWKRVSAIYVSSVLGGSALSTVLEPHVYSAGASAGILGLATANILDFILNYEVVKLRTLRAVFMITFVYHSILLGLYREYNYKGEFKIDYISHAGGLCAGISASFLYLKYEYLSETLHLMRGILGLFTLFSFMLLFILANSRYARLEQEKIVTQDGEEILEDPYREFRHSSLEL